MKGYYSAKDKTKVHAIFQEIANSLVSIAISSAKPLPQFDQKLSKTPRKTSFLSRIKSENAEEIASSPSLFLKSSATEGSTDILKRNTDARPRKNSTLDITATDEEVFYGLKYQVGVSVPRKVSVFQRVCSLRESPLINEGTLVLDWM